MTKSRNQSARSRVTVLASGGIDSSTCMAYFLKKGLDVEGMFIAYGQVAMHRELRAAKRVCKHFGVPLHIVRVLNCTRKGAGLIVGRNAFLVCTAVLEVETDSRIVAIGIHSGTRYRDCTPTFVKALQKLFDATTGGSVQVSAPFLKWTKRDIWKLAKTLKVPLSATYSCERGHNQPCGKCESCSDLEILRAGAN